MKSNAASWQFIEPQLSSLRIRELTESVYVVLARVGDYTQQLLPDETSELEKMAPVRQRGYATARYCAQLGQIAMQRSPGPVLRDGAYRFGRAGCVAVSATRNRSPVLPWWRIPTGALA